MIPVNILSIQKNASLLFFLLLQGRHQAKIRIMSASDRPVRVGISIGDFNGIGPEIIMKALQDKSITDFFTPIVFGSGKMFTYQKNVFKININFNYIQEVSQAIAGKINMVNLWKDNVTVTLGTPTEESTRLAMDSLESAVEALKSGQIDCLVTAPINKDEMMKHGFAHAGHTGFLEEKFGHKGLMFLVSEELKVAVVTHHIPISQVATAVTAEAIKKSLHALNQSLVQDFQIQRPKIAVLGLNPHAGDGGKIGTEEATVITPAIREAFDEGMMVFGPFPADSFFQPNKLAAYDAVLAMYHDQGLIPFKTKAYDLGVNFTAGLPAVRTSPDHGTAYDIAGQGIADATSFSEALFAAVRIFKNRSEYQELYKNRLRPQTKNSGFEKDEDLPR